MLKKYPFVFLFPSDGKVTVDERVTGARGVIRSLFGMGPSSLLPCFLKIRLRGGGGGGWQEKEKPGAAGRKIPALTNRGGGGNICHPPPPKQKRTEEKVLHKHKAK